MFIHTNLAQITEPCEEKRHPSSTETGNQRSDNQGSDWPVQIGNIKQQHDGTNQVADGR